MPRLRSAVIIALLAACGDPDPMMTTTDAPSNDGDTDATPPARHIAYISGYGPDIAAFELHTASGELSPLTSVAAFKASPSFLAMTPTHLYAASESASRVGAYSIDRATGALTFINDQASGGNGPAHVSVDESGKYVLVANYGGGTIAVLPVRSDGGLDAASQTISPGTNAHEILTAPGNRFVFVPCKGSDYIAQYTFDPQTGTLAPNAVPRLMTAAGAGPRHVAFAPDGAHAYLINELDSTLVALAFAASTGRLTASQTVSTRAAGATGANTGAEVVVHPSGNFVVGSNRGDNNLAVFRIAASTGMLTLVGHTATGGMTPRNFTIDPSGAWLYVANQNSSNVVTFKLDAASGALTRTGTPITAPQPSFVGFVALP
ncbi:lactonase family protein [soil metagenome]